jgi:hypothetical protein
LTVAVWASGPWGYRLGGRIVRRLCRRGMGGRVESGVFVEVGRTSGVMGECGDASGDGGCANTLCSGTGGVSIGTLCFKIRGRGAGGMGEAVTRLRI